MTTEPQIVKELPRTAKHFESFKDQFNKLNPKEYFVTDYTPAKIGLLKQYAAKNQWTLELFTDNSIPGQPRIFAKRTDSGPSGTGKPLPPKIIAD